MAKKKKFVEIRNAGDRSDYVRLLKKIHQDGVCPFCPENFKYHTKPILRNGKYWLTTENMNPYPGTTHHYLFVHKKHVEMPDRVTPAAWKELQSHIAWLISQKKLPAGGFFMRFGDTRYTGATVAHLHAQLVVGAKRSPKNELLVITLGHKKKE
jgi:diadenosine tetraphosphate (Ap4A) HIT family hydrolase